MLIIYTVSYHAEPIFFFAGSAQSARAVEYADCIFAEG